MKNIYLVILIVCIASVAYADASIYVVPAITDSKILPTSVISSNYLSNTIAMTASAGEYESASFVIHANQDAGSASVTASDLTGSGGSIAAANVDIRVVKVWYQAGDLIDLDGVIKKTLAPELLLKDDSLVNVQNNDNYLKVNGGYVLISSTSGIQGFPSKPTPSQFNVQDAATLQPVDIAAGTNKQFWVTVKVPDNTPAGTYSGTITIKNPSTTYGTITLTLRVLPFTLSAPDKIYALYYDGQISSNWPTGSISAVYKNEAQFRAEVRDMVQHGMTNLYLVPYDNGNDKTSLGKMLSIMKDEGMTGPTLWWGMQMDYKGSDLTALKDEMRSIKNFAATYGFTDFYVYGIDETNIDNPTNRAQIDAIHQIGGKVYSSDYTGDSWVKNIAPVLDSLNEERIDSSITNAYHDNGHTILLYGNPQAGVEKPATYRKNYGLYLWQINYDGEMDFNYQWDPIDGVGVWDDFDDQNVQFRDEVFAYPTAGAPIDTIEWEGFREGVDDIRYLTTLQKTIASAKSQGKDTSAAEGYLATLKSSNLAAEGLSDVRSKIVNYTLALMGDSTTTTSSATSTTSTTSTTATMGTTSSTSTTFTTATMGTTSTSTTTTSSTSTTTRPTTTSTISTTTVPTTTTTTSTSSTTTVPKTTTTTTSTTTTTIPPCISTTSATLSAGNNSIDFQTPHDYPNNLNCISGVYTCPTGYYAKVYVRYETEPVYDLFYVTDNTTHSSQSWSGNSSGYVWLTPTQVNAVKFRFLSDYNNTFWGVDVDKINCYMPSTTTSSATTTTTTATTTTTTTSSTTTTATSTTQATTTTAVGYIQSIQTTATTTQTTTSTTTQATTTTIETCKMQGDYPPCGEVTVTEVLDAITKWTQGTRTIANILDLINAWAYGGYYFM